MKARTRNGYGAAFTCKQRRMAGRFDPAGRGGLRSGQSQESSLPCNAPVCLQEDYRGTRITKKGRSR